MLYVISFNLGYMKYAHCRSFFVGNASTRIISHIAGDRGVQVRMLGEWAVCECGDSREADVTEWRWQRT